MMNQGGRGKKAPYSTVVMRIPAPIKGEVQQIIRDFHGEQKPVTGLDQLPASLVADWFCSAQPVEGHDSPPATQCYSLDEVDWIGDDWWMENEGEKLATFLELSDRINQVLWQIDNSNACGIGGGYYEGLGDVDEILALLVKYNLIYLDVPSKPALLNEIFAIAEENIHWNSGPADVREYMIGYAFEERRWDILAAFEVGKNPPVDRKQYWKQYYSERLGKVNIDYWNWLLNPESLDFCQELSDLLSLSRPSQDAALVLQALPEGKDPFSTVETKPGEISFGAFFAQGKFANWEPQRKQEARSAFRDWHFQALSSLGKEKLEAIYKTCYKVSWSLVEGILYNFNGDWWEVLGISPDSTLADAKKAFKGLAKVHHPDAGGDEERMRLLNRAMELAEKAFETGKYKVNKR